MTPLERTRQYADDVLSGREIAGPHVRNACKRLLHDLEHAHERGLWFDEEAAGRAMWFFENVLQLPSEGQFEGKPFDLHPSQAFKIGNIFGWKREDGTRRFRRAYIEEGKGNGKALCVATKIPTPNGWTTMGELVAGDSIYGADGRVCKVVQAHPISDDRECYRLTFDDGEQVVASAEHLWAVYDRVRESERVVDTKFIAANLRRKNGAYQSINFSVRMASPIAGGGELPIPAYTLGAWIGDGDSDCARMTCAFSDIQVIREIESEGVPITQQSRHSTTTGRFSLSSGRGNGLDTVNAKLRLMGLLGNKHIPAVYLRASVQDRLSLLQGLMDTDGYIDARGQCEYTSTREEIAKGVLELLSSLGIKAGINKNSSKLYGKDCGYRYRVMFHPGETQVFRLERKLARQGVSHSRRRLSGERRIVACERVDSTPVRCITVDSHDSLFLCGEGMIPTHNSPMAGGIALMGLCGDGESGSQVYAIASHKDQAGILFRDAVSMVKASPTLQKRLAFSGGEGREYNIAHHASASFFRPASRDVGKTGSGYRPYFVLADEVHEMSDGKIISMMENGFKFRRSPLLFMITNSGSDRNSIAWHQHEHAIKVAAGHNEAVLDPTFIGEPIDDTTFSFVCALDEGDDPLHDPSCWKKANPMLGVTITEEWLGAQVKRAKQLPSDLNEVLRLNFCVWTDAESAWMSRDVIEPLLNDFDPAEHHGKRISIGMDLSQSRDITATGNVVKTGDVEVWAKDKAGRDIKVSKPTFDIWIEAWTPGDTMQAREERDKLPYTVWAKQGHIHAPKGENISYLHVAQTLVEYSQDYDVAMVAYDRYAFRRFEEDADTVGLAVNFVEHPQGGTKKGKPTEEMEAAAKQAGRVAEGLWFPSSLRMLEDAMLEGRVRFKRNPVLISAIMSAVVEQDKWDNKWLSKQRSVNKIDAIVAVVMAFGAANAMQAEKKKLQLFMVG